VLLLIFLNKLDSSRENILEKGRRKMQTVPDGSKEKKCQTILTMIQTQHFTQRYYERILGKQVTTLSPSAMRDHVYEDINKKLLPREKLMLDIFSTSQNVVRLPFNKYYQLIVCNNTLITIYH
tara:strand:- start:11 stop:379 length:369 start_codon:yes stop_codon:yes gene_type:complete